MKKLLLLVSILLISCSSQDSVTISKDEYNQLKGDTIKPEYPKYIVIDGYYWEVSLSSDGHEYVDNGRYDSYSCMHWIECKRCKPDTIRKK